MVDIRDASMIESRCEPEDVLAKTVCGVDGKHFTIQFRKRLPVVVSFQRLRRMFVELEIRTLFGGGKAIKGLLNIHAIRGKGSGFEQRGFCNNSCPARNTYSREDTKSFLRCLFDLNKVTGHRAKTYANMLLRR